MSLLKRSMNSLLLLIYQYQHFTYWQLIKNVWCELVRAYFSTTEVLFHQQWLKKKKEERKKTFSTKHDSWSQGPSSCLSLRGSCTPESAFESVSLCAPSPVTFRGHRVQRDSRGFSFQLLMCLGLIILLHWSAENPLSGDHRNRRPVGLRKWSRCLTIHFDSVSMR